MEFDNSEDSGIEGCIILTADRVTDRRGWLVKPYARSGVVDNWMSESVVSEIFWSESKSGVFRGMHLQLPPFAVSKTVFCISGTIIDFVLDLRTDSQTYLKSLEIPISTAPNHSQGVIIPRGCAHGFLTTTNESNVLYLQSGQRVEEGECGIHFSSLRSNILSHENQIIVSDRDSSLMSLGEFPLLTKAEWEIS